jgi:alpha-ketoglutarate-dependent taurine dioxygenase
MAHLKTRDLGPTFGAEVIGLEPRAPLDADTIAQLRKLFDEKSILLFRDIDVDSRFRAYISEILIGNDVPDPSQLKVMENFMISNKEPAGAAPYGRLLYHSDQMWSPTDRVDLISLYGKEVGQPATPTLFISAGDAWDTLPDDLRARVKDRKAVQHYDPANYKKRAQGDPDVLVSTYSTGDDFVTTPIAYTHPRTGRTILYVCQQTTQKIVDLSVQESDQTLDALFEHMYASGKEFAHHWRERDFLVWDNIALQHARPNVKTEGPPRTLLKTLAPLPQAKIQPIYANVAAQ